MEKEDGHPVPPLTGGGVLSIDSFWEGESVFFKGMTLGRLEPSSGRHTLKSANSTTVPDCLKRGDGPAIKGICCSPESLSSKPSLPGGS